MEDEEKDFDVEIQEPEDHTEGYHNLNEVELPIVLFFIVVGTIILAFLLK